MVSLAIVAISLALGISSVTAQAGENNTKHLGYASYSGYNQDNGVSYWLGMRYAAAPTGSLRFAGPQDPEFVPGVQDATTHGPLCISTGSYPIPDTESEDCLFLDVYAPTNATNTTGLPVFFWIQGGGYNSLSNANYDGTGLIEASDYNIVVVPFNYRVGPYGFLASQEVEEAGSLNNGIKDMIKALQWVQRYIHIFGGDPGHVTIGGDSAGAGAITLLLTAYGGNGELNHLFHAAAAESQSFGPQLTVAESQFLYDNLTERTNCTDTYDTFDCLRYLDVDTLQQQNVYIPYPNGVDSPLFPYGPAIDYDLIPDYTYALFGAGKFMKIPVIFGDDTNEGTIFTPKGTASVAEANTYLHDNFPFLTDTQLSTIDSIYMSEPDSVSYPNAGDYWQGVSNAYGEMRYICPGMYISTSYYYNTWHDDENSNWNYHYAVIDENGIASGYGTQHTIEVNAIWGPQYVSSAAPASYSTYNQDIVPVMQGYWTSFIRAYNPNTYRAAGSPEWQPWDGSNQRLFIRTNQTHMETAPDDQMERCRTMWSMAVANHQ